MIALVKMWTTGHPASDGSIIRRNKVEEYLQSEGYRNAIESGSILCSITHAGRSLKSRNDTSSAVGVVGKDDSLLLLKEIVGKITKIFLPDDPMDEWVYGICELFDENLMDEKSAENIRFIKGLIRNGVKISTSSVIIALN